MAHLGSDDHRVAVAACRHPLADDGLRLASAIAVDPMRVGVGGIDEVAARVCVGIEHLERRRLVGGPAEDIAAETKRVDEEVGGAEADHGYILAHPRRGPIAGGFSIGRKVSPATTRAWAKIGTVLMSMPSTRLFKPSTRSGSTFSSARNRGLTTQGGQATWHGDPRAGRSIRSVPGWQFPHAPDRSGRNQPRRVS
jgi:hypothetical protein